MHRLSAICLFFLLSCHVSQSKKVEREKYTGQLTFETSTHDFGTVKEGDVVGFTFKFQNKGSGLVRINEVETSCGCIEAICSLKEIEENQIGKVEVIFDTSGWNGNQVKRVIVNYNNDQKEELLIWSMVK